MRPLACLFSSWQAPVPLSLPPQNIVEKTAVWPSSAGRRWAEPATAPSSGLAASALSGITPTIRLRAHRLPVPAVLRTITERGRGICADAGHTGGISGTCSRYSARLLGNSRMAFSQTCGEGRAYISLSAVPRRDGCGTYGIAHLASSTLRCMWAGPVEAGGTLDFHTQEGPVLQVDVPQATR